MPEPILPYLLFALGSGIILILGSLHMYMSFRGRKLHPRQAETRTRMEQDFPVLTRETSMWRAWTGFNMSHSLGAIFFGLVNLLVLEENPTYYFSSSVLYSLNIIVLVFYSWLGRNYWFSIPRMGILTSLILFISARLILMFTS